VKFAATDGHCIWSTGMEIVQPTDWTYAHALTVDEAGDVYVGGRFEGTTTVGGGMTSVGGDDAFVMKLAGTDGTVQWAHGYGGAGNDSLGWWGIDVRNGVLALVGTFNTSANFGGTTPVTSPHGGDAGIVASYSAATGALQWYRVYAGTGAARMYPNYVIIAHDGSWLVDDAFEGNLDLGSTVLIAKSVPFDVALLRLDGSNGAPLAVHQTSQGDGYHFQGNMREDPQGGLVVLTYVSNGADLGQGPITIQSTNPVPALMHIDANLSTIQWTRVFDAPDALFDDVLIGTGGRIYVGGSFTGNIPFGATQVTSAHANSDDGLLAALSSTADLQWIETRTSTMGTRDPAELALGPNDRIYQGENVITGVPHTVESTSWAIVSGTQGP